MISAILTSFNELSNSIFWDNYSRLRERTQLIVVDGGSQDGTLGRLRDLGADVHVLAGSPRARRYNRGLRQARGEIVLLVHPRTLVGLEALEALRALEGRTVWGAFTHRFDDDHPLLRFTSWYSNRVRGAGRGIFYLDHGLFLSRDLCAQAEFPDVELFEDTHFCRRLRRVQRPLLLPVRTTTSAIRFRRNGMLRQILLNQTLKLLFHLGVSDAWMNRIYERGLALNKKG